jgi:hypothetical protein
MRRILILSLAFPLYLSTQAAAQTCAGMPAFSSGKMQLSGGAQFANGANSFGGNFAYGTPRSFYGKAGIGTTSYDPYDGSSFDLNLGGGYQIPLHASRTAELCPVASLGLSSGPNDVLGSGVDLSSRTFAIGASVGALLGRNPQLRFVPNGAFQLANTRASVDDGTNSASDSQSYALLTLGTGFVFNSRFSLNPSVSVPIGLEGADASFGLMGAMNFGH